MTAMSKILFFVIVCLFGGSFLSNARNINSYKKSDSSKIHERFKRQIVPGTNWCGRGNKAENYDDLGTANDTDACCRAHDLCPMHIGALQIGYGLKNPDLSTRSHCSCDKQFFNCLEKSGTKKSRAVGNLYFNILRKMCFDEKKCPSGQTCPKEYEFVKAQSWLPTEEELEEMQKMIFLIQPELEVGS